MTGGFAGHWVVSLASCLREAGAFAADAMNGADWTAGRAVLQRLGSENAVLQRFGSANADVAVRADVTVPADVAVPADGEPRH